MADGVSDYIIDEISMVLYQMLCMIDARLRTVKTSSLKFWNTCNQQPEYLQPATHLWRLFTLCELTENMRQQGDHTFIDILNALRIGELTAHHFSILMQSYSRPK